MTLSSWFGTWDRGYGWGFIGAAACIWLFGSEPAALAVTGLIFVVGGYFGGDDGAE